MELQLINNVEPEQFDRFALSHPSGSFLQCSSWGTWMEQNKQKVHRIGVANPAGELLLVAQVILTKIPKLGGWYGYIPYGPLAKQEQQNTVLDFFYENIKTAMSNLWFLRIEPKQQISSRGKMTKHIQPGKTLVLDLTKTEQQLQNEMHHKTRYNIRVATKHGVKVKTEHSAEALNLIEQTAKRHGYKSHGLTYYQNLVNFFQALNSENNSLKVTLYSAWYENQILAGAIMVDCGTTRTYLFGGTSDLHKNVMAPYLLHWQAVQDAKQAGLNTYDFWGIETASGQTPGFVRFKLGWGGTQIEYPKPTDIIYKPLHYQGYKLLRQLNKLLAQ